MGEEEELRARPSIRGRGSRANPGNRFESSHYEPSPEEEADPGKPATAFLPDFSESLITTNNSPDVGFTHSLNPYRGCEHGCVYCYARPTHEYLGFSAGLDFESKIMVKERAPELLRRELSKPAWTGTPLAMSGVTDCYQPVEKRLRITRRCLEVMSAFHQPVGIITKNGLITRDLDLLGDMAARGLVHAHVSITTLRPELTAKLEPRTARPSLRLETVRQLAAAGIPVNVMAAPVIPGLTDTELPAILEAAAEAGARSAGYTLLRLPLGVAPLFEDWLDRHEPGKKDRVLSRIRAVRGGKLNDARFGSRMRGEGVFAEQIHTLFKISARRCGLDRGLPPLRTDRFQVPGKPRQLELEL